MVFHGINHCYSFKPKFVPLAQLLFCQFHFQKMSSLEMTNLCSMDEPPHFWCSIVIMRICLHYNSEDFFLFLLCWILPFLDTRSSLFFSWRTSAGHFLPRTLSLEKSNFIFPRDESLVIKFSKFFFFFPSVLIHISNWRKIALQYCVSFC